MCGIVAIIGKKPVSERLVSALEKLEYRGYDSAGIATIDGHKIEARHALGKLVHLQEELDEKPLPGNIGIGHTRWATHGALNLKNTHPHSSKRVSLVHNGIIENHAELRGELTQKGYKFCSQTDSEVLVHLIDSYIDQDYTPEEATQAALERVTGSYALGILFEGQPNLLIGARKGSPLAIGYGDGEMYLGSDRLALMPFTHKVSYLEEGDMVVLTQKSATIYDMNKRVVTRPVRENKEGQEPATKGKYRHFMMKEIYEQPEAIQRALALYLSEMHDTVALPKMPVDLVKLKKVTIVACGTAFYAAMVAKYWLEHYANLSVEVDIASEFRYRKSPIEKEGLSIFISQSGETADTLAAHTYVKERGQKTLAVVNVPESSLARAADEILPTAAGTEVGVASTKAFTTQLTVLACFTLACAKARKTLTVDEIKHFCERLAHVPEIVVHALQAGRKIKKVAIGLSEAQDVLYLGRGSSYPIALEGALKLKEISYIHAEGYAAGEMKHGPIALIDTNVPVVVILPQDDLFEKTASSVNEILARGAPVIVIGDDVTSKKLKGEGVQSIVLPAADPFIAPIVYAVPIQLLAYHTAVVKGTDVDQPRNLAKSVTVE